MFRIVVLLLVALSTGVGLDFRFKSDRSDGDYSFSDYIDDAMGEVGAQASGGMDLWNQHFDKPSLRKAVPRSLEGWDGHGFGPDDLPILLGRAPTDADMKEFDRRAGQRNFAISSSRDIKVIDRAYYLGEVGIHLNMVHATDKGLRSNAMQLAIDLQDEMIVSAGNAIPFAEVDGVVFRELMADERSDSKLRMIVGNLGKDISIRLTTRSFDNPAIADLLGAIDYQMLNSLLDVPLDHIAEAKLRLFASTEIETATALFALSSGSEPVGDAVGSDGSAPDAKPAAAPKADPNPAVAELAKAADAAPRLCTRKAGVLECVGE